MPIAVIGIAVRAGAASTADEFFEMISRGRSSWSPEIPPERFNNASFYHPNAGKLGSVNTNGGSFIQQDITKFDAPFFSITELEATSMDPQQRILLECAYEALDSAGVPKHDTVGKDFGVFIGAGSPEYEFDLFRDSETQPMFQATGNHLAMQSNKISHFFDWRGPSVTMDTACSSSLTAVHFGCQSLRNRESSVVLVGGCNLNIIPEYFINYSTSRLLGDSGKCFSFDARGTGYGRGEGCGMLLLKPLDQALRDNDCVRAIVAASGVNQDGYTPGITMPNGESQEKLVRSIYKNAGLDPTFTGYVEAHGTGTRVGDPIEVTALHNVFNEGRTKKNPLFLGSVKSNIGHLESASGILAMIKTTVMLDRGFILPNYDFKVGNPRIPFDDWGLKVPVRQLPWPRGKRFASVNNFGFGGTNAHIVMERPPMRQNHNNGAASSKEAPRKRLFILSAADKAACISMMSNLGVYLEQRPEMFQRDLMSKVAYTLGQRRSLLPWRVAIPASESFELVERISNGTIKPVKETGHPIRVGFVCTGQGAQWWAMGKELYSSYPVFQETIDVASQTLQGIGAQYDLIEELNLDEKTTRINQAHISQPSCTAIQLAIIDLLRSWGVTPAAVVGHSSGEIAAAYAAGILSVESAMIIAHHRGRLIPVLKERHPYLDGSMLAIGCGYEDVEDTLSSITNGKARIACYNSPQSLTISGDSSAIAEIQQKMEEKQIFNRKLLIETAYHSHHMDLIAEDYMSSIQSLPQPKSSDVRFFSSLTGKEALHSDFDSSYWVRNLTSPVRFAQACAKLVAPTEDFATGVDVLVEIGPHSALQGPVKQILKAVGGATAKLSYAPTLVRKRHAVDTMLELASSLFCKGSELNFAKINFPTSSTMPGLLVDLPKYPWNHSTTYWHESRISHTHKNRKFPRHDLLGSTANYSNELEPIWRNIVRLDDIPWLRDHKIQGLTIFPISAFVAMSVEAVAQLATTRGIDAEQIDIYDLNVHTPLMMPDDQVELTTSFRPSKEGSEKTTYSFIIHSHSNSKGWTENCTGTITIKTNEVDVLDTETRSGHSLARLNDMIEHTREVDSSIEGTNLYDTLSQLGVTYGPAFQGIENCCATDQCAAATITVTDTASQMPERTETGSTIHPSLLEQLVQMYWPILGVGRRTLNTICLPSSIKKITVYPKVLRSVKNPGKILQAYCTSPMPLSTERTSQASMLAVTEKEIAISIEDLTIAPLPTSDMGETEETARDLCFKQIWEPILDGVNIDCHGRPVLIIHGQTMSQKTLALFLAASIQSRGGANVEMGQLDLIDPTGKVCICLTELDHSILSNVTEKTLSSLQKLVQNAHSLLWVTRGAYGQANGNPTSNMVSGFSRAIRSESMFKFATLDLDADQPLDTISATTAIIQVLSAVIDATTIANVELEFQERKGRFWTPRIVKDEIVNDYVHKQSYPPAVEETTFGDPRRALKLADPTPNSLDSLHFVDDPSLTQDLLANQVEIEVKSVGISLMDAHIYSGRINNSSIGQECSGIVRRVGKDVRDIAVGNRVAAVATGSVATSVRTDSSFVLKLPDDVSFQQAANLPLAQCVARYSLFDLAHLDENDLILILNGAGATGQAAITLAQNIGSTIFVTVSTSKDKVLLRDAYGLPGDHILSSQDDQLWHSIRRISTNRRVDVVLGIENDPKLMQSGLECLAKFGRFIHVKSSDAPKKAHVDLTALDSNAALLSCDIHSIAKDRPRVIQRLIREISRSLRQGKICETHGSDVSSISVMSQALKQVQSSSTESRTVITLNNEDTIKATPSKREDKLFKEDATYILIGGTGGLGRGMTRWMAKKGAKNIVLLSRTGSVTGSVKILVDDMMAVGVNVVVQSCDVAKRASVDSFMCKGLVGLPPVRGIIHGAMTLRDTLFDKMVLNDWIDVIESKVQGVWNFHNAFQSVPLDFFIVYSSSAAAMGGRGQAAYAAANSFLDAFAQYRRALGMPCASLGPTAVMDAGYIFENAEMWKDVQRNIGDNYIYEAEVFSLLESILDGTASRSCNDHIITGVSLDPTNLPFWATDAKYKHLRLEAEATAALLNNGAKTVSWNATFKAAATATDAEQVVCNGLVEKIAKTLGLDLEEVDPTRNLSSYSLDSLTAIDVRNFITREFESALQVLELLASGTIATLAKNVCAKSKIQKASA
ncbi:putative polyketide synthase [Aaosphaeria arxii CBS 175.79]|uniref:Putative polyketide synthase n=1 Tax=Aaosphaeria arxii CBS 175.79 TaxID=1450172 RepID=A0A6A5X7N4_9PLEO|nr:putative polyketide synthase [Aaosphaeria arxii CBS 175.79]KAF2008794.1 putative polyketide synthase [Aaosphaeria arxii CBS 175.79]